MPCHEVALIPAKLILYQKFSATRHTLQAARKNTAESIKLVVTSLRLKAEAVLHVAWGVQLYFSLSNIHPAHPSCRGCR